MESKRKLFGTDGIRGVANQYPLTCEMVQKIGRAIAYIFKKDLRRHKIVIGKDTRLSGYMLETSLSSGICSMGVDVLLIGPLPTPGIAFITSSMRADAGAVISASHNSYQDNGIKFFDKDGFKLPDELEERIEKLIFSDEIENIRPTADQIGKAFRIEDAIGRYIVFLKNTFPKDLTLEGLKIVIDCANGASYKVAPFVFEELGATVIPMGVKPDGKNINFESGSLHPEYMAKKVLEEKADLGLSFDGDADRLIISDEKGNIIDGDQIMAVCAKELAEKGKLSKNTVVTTIMSNAGLDISLEPLGINIVRTAVGDRYVVEKMLSEGYNLGGEQSGHIIFLDHNTTGDGILSALQVLAILVRKNMPMSYLSNFMIKLPQVLKNVKVPRKENLELIPEVYQRIKSIKEELGKRGRILVRYSGTEPILRIMLEDENKDKIKNYAEELAFLVQKNIV